MDVDSQNGGGHQGRTWAGDKSTRNGKNYKRFWEVLKGRQHALEKVLSKKTDGKSGTSRDKGLTREDEDEATEESVEKCGIKISSSLGGGDCRMVTKK